ncbi:MAG: adenylate/guanylate cyclase domain-containing protein [Hyphomicrobiaceae bacterium]
MSDEVVWLEGSDGRSWPIAGTCSIGRAVGNDVLIEDGRVSRRHALVHKQDDGEFWLIDLGSGNGTYLNGRRVTLATRLRDQDVLAVGPADLRFRQQVMSKPSARQSAGHSEQTIIQVKTLQSWLLVADIKGSTALAQRLPTTELAVLMGKWMAACKEIVDQSGGAINKFLGDGFLAYWFADDRGTAAVARAVATLSQMQRSGQDPAFRIAVHRGSVTIGGSVSGGEDSLSGPNVIRVFRMEALASTLRRDVLISEEAQATPGFDLTLVDAGLHLLPEFDSTPRRFFSVA